ncbi:MAG TPA: peptidoglycan-binding domain-containing protein [Candidatus Paceibacterota bacterium]
MKKQIITVVLLIGMFAPVAASADTVSTSVSVVPQEVWSKMMSLKTQIKELQARIEALRGSQTAQAISAVGVTDTPASATPGCLVITRALYKGTSGSDVKKLQSYLMSYPGVVWSSDAGASSYFGTATMEAVGFFQSKEGLASFPGVVDKLTADRISKLSCGL